MILAFHSEPTLKAAVIDRLREHRRLDEIVQKIYYEDGRGCHLGCITHTAKNTHETAERLFGIEERIGYWLEAVFEGLPKKDCAKWVMESTEAIPCGADMSLCHHYFCAWLLGESGLLTITEVNREAIAQVQQLHEQAARGIDIEREQWSAAWSAESVWSAAMSARSAACSARSAESAAMSAWSAACSARSAASAESAWSSAWKTIAKKSIEIFAAAPVPNSEPTIDCATRIELCERRLWCPDNAVVV